MTSAASLLNAKRIILRGEYSSRDEGSKKGELRLCGEDVNHRSF
jgi:hypothetical protein